MAQEKAYLSPNLGPEQSSLDHFTYTACMLPAQVGGRAQDDNFLFALAPSSFTTRPGHHLAFRLREWNFKCCAPQRLERKRHHDIEKRIFAQPHSSHPAARPPRLLHFSLPPGRPAAGSRKEGGRRMMRRSLLRSGKCSRLPEMLHPTVTGHLLVSLVVCFGNFAEVPP